MPRPGSVTPLAALLALSARQCFRAAFQSPAERLPLLDCAIAQVIHPVIRRCSRRRENHRDAGQAPKKPAPASSAQVGPGPLPTVASIASGNDRVHVEASIRHRKSCTGRGPGRSEPLRHLVSRSCGSVPSEFRRFQGGSRADAQEIIRWPNLISGKPAPLGGRPACYSNATRSSYSVEGLVGLIRSCTNRSRWPPTHPGPSLPMTWSFISNPRNDGHQLPRWRRPHDRLQDTTDSRAKAWRAVCESRSQRSCS